MSWYGGPPQMTREAAKSLLGVAPCRLCVYWTRITGKPRFPIEVHNLDHTGNWVITSYLDPDQKCPRCGLAGFR